MSRIRPTPGESAAGDGREGHGSRYRDFRTSRLEAFSDGVFAIAITLLVLDIAVPVTNGSGLLDAIADEWPSYLAYVVSFSTVGATWLAHTAITEYVERADLTFIRLNLILLLVVGFIPFPTKLVADYIGNANAERVAVTVYGITLLVASLMISILWRYAAAHRLIGADTEDQEIRDIAVRSTPSLAAYLVLIVLGFFKPTAAVVGYLGIALTFIFPVTRVLAAFTWRRNARREAAGVEAAGAEDTSSRDSDSGDTAK